MIPQFPDFEGQEVDAAVLRVSGGIELVDIVGHVDDEIEIVVKVKLIGINHLVHAPTGRLQRIQTAKVVDSWRPRE